MLAANGSRNVSCKIHANLQLVGLYLKHAAHRGRPQQQGQCPSALWGLAPSVPSLSLFSVPLPTY